MATTTPSPRVIWCSLLDHLSMPLAGTGSGSALVLEHHRCERASGRLAGVETLDHGAYPVTVGLGALDPDALVVTRSMMLVKPARPRATSSSTGSVPAGMA